MEISDENDRLFVLHHMQIVLGLYVHFCLYNPV